MERVAKQGIICSLISHLEANSFLQLVSEKCSSVIRTGSFIWDTGFSAISARTHLPAHLLASVYLPTIRDEGHFIPVGPPQCEEARFLFCHVGSSDECDSKAEEQETGLCSSRGVILKVWSPGPAVLPSPESWWEMHKSTVPPVTY